MEKILILNPNFETYPDFQNSNNQNIMKSSNKANLEMSNFFDESRFILAGAAQGFYDEAYWSTSRK